MLESAVYSALSSFDNEELYSTIEEKSARLMFSLVNNHAFIDGNKRIGVFVMLMTLELNNVKLGYTQQELIELGLSTADGEIGYEDIFEWIKKHKV